MLKLIYSLIVAILFSSMANAQVDNSFFTGATKKFIDTLAVERSAQNLKESSGILEKEVDPDKYILGPGDVFSIFIPNSTLRDLEAEITPDGKLPIPQSGMVDLKGKTLSEGYKLILEKVKKVYKGNDTEVSLKKIRQFKVTISGVIRKASIVSSSPAERVSEVIDKSGGYKENSSLRNIVLLRNSSNQTFDIDLMRYHYLGDENSNMFVNGGDIIIVNSIDERDMIEIAGEVPNPNEFEFKKGDKLSDLVKFGQGFYPSAFLDSVEFSRFNPSTGKNEISYLNLTTWANQLFFKDVELKGDFELNSGDRVFVRRKFNYSDLSYVMIEGAVRYPGKYPITDGKDNVYDLIKRCGGFLSDASLPNTMFIRQAELDVKDEQLERLKAIPIQDMSISEFKYFQAKINEKKGVMSINFANIIKNPGDVDNILLVNKDSIIVPDKKDYVNIQGRVNNPGSVIYNSNYTYLDYINIAGGFGYRADEDETFITKSKGQQFLASDNNYKIEQGDVILVPPTKDKDFWDYFTEFITVTTQLVTILGVVFAIVLR